MAERVQTLLQLSDELVERLDARAARAGVSRSGLVRELLTRALRDDEAEARSRRLREAYERDPQAAGADAWGDLSAWSDENRRRNAAALRREEEGAGGW